MAAHIAAKVAWLSEGSPGRPVGQVDVDPAGKANKCNEGGVGDSCLELPSIFALNMGSLSS